MALGREPGERLHRDRDQPERRAGDQRGGGRDAITAAKLPWKVCASRQLRWSEFFVPEDVTEA